MKNLEIIKEWNKKVDNLLGCINGSIVSRSKWTLMDFDEYILKEIEAFLKSDEIKSFILKNRKTYKNPPKY